MSLVLWGIIAVMAFVQLDLRTAAAQPAMPITAGFRVVNNYVASQEATWPNWFPPAAAGQIANRSFGYSVPSQFAACKAAGTCAANSFPLIVALHGGRGNLGGARNWVIEGNAMNQLGSNNSPALQGYETKAAFFLYPEGVPTMGWRHPGDDTVGPPAPGGALPLNFPDGYKDVHFITELVHKMLNNPSYVGIIDRNRIYVLGYSSGAHMAEVLACLRAGVFRSFGLFNRELNPNMMAKCGLANDPDIVAGTGAPNSTVPLPGGYPPMPGGAQYVGINQPGARTRPMMFFSGSQDAVALQAAVDKSYDAFKLLMGATGADSPTPLGDRVNESAVLGGANTLWELHTNAAGPGGSTLRRVRIDGGDHSVPTFAQGVGSGPRGTASCITDAYCNHSVDYSGMDRLWAFWNQHAGLNLP